MQPLLDFGAPEPQNCNPILHFGQGVEGEEGGGGRGRGPPRPPGTRTPKSFILEWGGECGRKVPFPP